MLIQKLRFTLLTCLILSGSGMVGQQWECSKEQHGIRIYTCRDTVSSYKLFKGEVDLPSDVRTVGRLIEDVRNFDIWDDDISMLRVIDSVPGKYIRYYIQYEVRWPFKDRDLCVEASIETDPGTGIETISARCDPDGIPQDPDHVRIEKYWQKWTISPMGQNQVHLTLEGYAEPAGEVPSWLANLAITDAPMNMLEKIRETLSQK